MLRIVLAVFTVSAALSPVYGQTNYCLEKFCGTPNIHIACNHDGAWGADCPTSPLPQIVELDLARRNQIINMHNVRRNNLAMGNVANYQPSKRMATTRWSPEMAGFAQLNVMQCKEQKDACHTTNKFLNSGQNIALLSYSGPPGSRTVQDLITAAINSWWGERTNANMAVINSFPTTWSGSRMDRFALMAHEKNWACGCGASTWTDGDNYFLFVCNYATNCVPGEPVYPRGTTAVDCLTGTNVNYDGLCKVTEEYDL